MPARGGVIEIDPGTLRKHFRKELDNRGNKGQRRGRKSLYTNALSGNVAAQIWWTKVRNIVQKDSDDADRARMSDEELIKALEEQTNRLGIKSI
jgi:hypothetical protein